MKLQRRQPSSSGVQDLLGRAVALHQSGQLEEGRKLYEQVLRREPRQPDALHLLGLLKAQAGDAAGGIELIRGAIKANARQPLFRLNLGRVLEGASRWAEAAEAYGQAARLTPLEADLHRLEANARIQAGQQGPAAAALRRLLLLVPDHAAMLSALGDALYDTGALLPAAASYGRAFALEPDLLVAGFNRGAALRDAGRVGEALAAFRAVATVSPLLTQAYEQIVDLAARSGDEGAAESACRSLLALAPDHPGAVRARGAGLSKGGRSAQATAWLARSAALEPANGEVPLGLGTLLQGLGRPVASAPWFRRALVLDPAAATALSGLGLALAGSGNGGTAVRAAVRAAALEPDRADLAANAGSVFHRLGQGQPARSWFRRAVALAPAGALGWVNVGTGLLAANDFEEAVRVFGRVLAAGAGEHEALARSNLGVALMSLGRHGEAVAAFRAALDLDPADPEVRSNLLFCLCFTEDADLDAVFEEHRRFERHVPPVPRPDGAFDRHSRDPEKRLRIGYVSPDFQRYPGPGFHFLLPLLERHDRSRVEVFCYYNDLKQDEATRRFQRVADGWRDSAAMPDDELERRIRDDSIDILVDCDGHMSRNRMPLFLRRPAPVQIGLPLYPNTSGLSTMDYQFADPRFAPPGAGRRHTEKLIRLPGCVLCYRPADSVFAPPERPPVETAGVFTFGSFSNLAKLNPPTLALWARVLRAVPDSRLMLKWRGLTVGGVARRFVDFFAAEGIAAERLVLRGTTPDPYEDYTRIDVALDPYFANGGTTNCDALWMGVPVLSIAGEAMISRWGAAMIGAVGLGDLVAETMDGYADLAVRLATDRGFLAAKRDGLRARMAASALMDEGGYAAAVESGYRAAWRRWCAGLPPEAITVGAGQ